jgi:hypothetical protein
MAVMIETRTDWAITAGPLTLLVVILASWLVSIRAQRTPQSVSNRWFALPAWAQIALGIAAIAIFIWLCLLQARIA